MMPPPHNWPLGAVKLRRSTKTVSSSLLYHKGRLLHYRSSRRGRQWGKNERTKRLIEARSLSQLARSLGIEHAAQASRLEWAFRGKRVPFSFCVGRQCWLCRSRGYVSILSRFGQKRPGRIIPHDNRLSHYRVAIKQIESEHRNR